MRGVPRGLGLLALVLLVAAAGFAALVFFVLLFSTEGSGELIATLVALAFSLLVLGAGIWGLRRAPRRGDRARPPAGGTVTPEL